MKHLRLIFVFLLAMLLFSCQKEESVTDNSSSETELKYQKSYHVANLPFEKAGLDSVVNQLNTVVKVTAKSADSETFSLSNTVVENRNNDRVSYSIGLTSNKAQNDRFHNLVIEKTPQKEAAFLITYHPTATYLDAVKRGFDDTPFEGSFSAQPLYYYQEGLNVNEFSVVCITYEVAINCTAGGNHTIDQINNCRGTKDQLPRWQRRTECHTFFPRGGDGPHLTTPPSPEDFAYPISLDAGGGTGTPQPKKPVHSQPQLTPKFVCLNADCSEIRAIDPIEITPVFVASINWLEPYFGTQEMATLANDRQFGVDVANFIQAALLEGSEEGSATKSKAFKQAVEVTKNAIALKREIPDLLFKECLALYTAAGNPDPITGASVSFYMILKHKNPAFFDVSAFSVGSESVQVGDYTLTPHYAASGRLVFYTAARYKGNKPIHDIEYVIQTDALENFKDKISYYTSSANIFYMGGIPGEAQVALAAGDYVEGLTKMWGEALHSAEWWFSSITILADAVVSPFLKTSLPKNQQRLNQHFQKWQNAKNNLPAHHVRDINVLWADRGYIARRALNNTRTIFKATDDEIAQAAERIKAHRTAQNAGTSGNYGYLEGKIGNITKNGEMVRSGQADQNITNIFDAIKVNSQQEIDGIGAWLRTTDSEYKMLNRLANELGAEKGKIYPHIKGELKIVSERAYCPYCQGVIQQFNKMFPNVKIILIDNVN